MKYLISILVLALAVVTKGEIKSEFTLTEATLTARDGNSDAAKLYEAMSITPTQIGEDLIKTIDYRNEYGIPVFRLNCSLSLGLAQYTCALKFFSSGALVCQEEKIVMLGINSAENLQRVERFFFHHSEQGSYRADVFRSEDGKLNIYKTLNFEGKVISLKLMYN